MKMKQFLALVMALLVSLSLAGCSGSSDENSASVQSVAMLMGVDLTGSSQYGGIVEAKGTTKVSKDASKTVDQCYVEVGDTVKAGDPLFSYDTDALQLSVDSAKLEVEQYQNSITSYESQITELEKEKKKASSSDKLSYTLQIQEAELNKSEAEYNLKQKQAEVERLEASLDQTEVTSEVSGVVQAINDPDNSSNSSDSSDSDAYITIMETGTYRIKGLANEETVRNMTVGTAVTAYSRTDSSQTWTGTIEEINTDQAVKSDSETTYYDSSDSSSSSAKYAFYVTLDSSDGLLIGQHVYLKVGEDAAQAESEGIRLPSGYVVQDGESAYVWAESDKGKLEKRSVTLGSYDEELDEYEITDGLALEDYIAYPDDTLTEGMSTVEYDESVFSDDGGDYSEVTTDESEEGFDTSDEVIGGADENVDTDADESAGEDFAVDENTQTETFDSAETTDDATEE